MAIFVASTKPISRGSGQSAVASASYRAGVTLQDNRYGKTHDYSKRGGVMSADIIMPSSLKNITISRQELWNLAEKTETRKNSRVAREWLVNLPHELDEQTRKQLAHDFAQALADKFGTIADCAIHRPTQKEIERGADARNYHAHIMFTTRKAELSEQGEIVLTDKADCEVSDSQRKKMGLGKAKDEVTEIRQLWETLANEKLLQHGHDLIDSRSYESQGIDILPQIKMGKTATHLERDGKVTVRGEINRAIAERNEIVWNKELSEVKRINEQADQIIFKSRIKSEPQKEIEPVAETPKPQPQSLDAVAQALALANNIKAKKADEEKAKALALAEQLRQQRAEQEKAQALAEQKRIEQQQQQQAEQRQDFTHDLKKMFDDSIQTVSETLSKKIDLQPQVGRSVFTVAITNDALKKLDDYIDSPRPKYQNALAKNERERLTNRTFENTETALKAIKDLRYDSDRREYLEPLKQSFDELVSNQKYNMTDEQQNTAKTLQREIENYSQEIAQSRSYGMGR